MRIKVFFKRYWRVFCSSLICVAVLAMFVPCLAYASAGLSTDFLDSLGFGGFGDCVDNEGDIISSLTEAITGMTSDEVTAEYYNQYYEFLQGDWWGLASGSGGIYDSSTNNFNDAYLEAMGMQYAMYNMVRPFDWDAFVLYAKARRAAELAESGSFDSDSYFHDNPQDSIKISSSGLKNVANYWGDYYKPMYTSTQYTWSYQSTGCADATKPYFIDLAPVYLESRGTWGNKDWSGIYLLPFVRDDDIDSEYLYSSYFYHVYSSKEDTTVYIHFDSYDLSTGKVDTEKSYIWDVVTYPYLGCFLDASRSDSSAGQGVLTFYLYKSFSDFQGNLNPTASAAFRNLNIGYLLSADFSVSKGCFYNLVNSVTFLPESNENDDYGFYLSAEPFELFMNQTSIDFDRIPDNYYITINGDTIYDYTLTDPDTGDTSTINEYITNNYTYITNDNGGDSGSGSGTSSGDVNVGGNVTVSGDVNVSGQIDINTNPIDVNVNTNPIDINVNVNGLDSSGGSDSSASGVEFDEDVSLNNYYDWMNEQTSGFSGFMSQFFSWLPPEIVVMLCAGFACVILARFLGR